MTFCSAVPEEDRKLMAEQEVERNCECRRKLIGIIKDMRMHKISRGEALDALDKLAMEYR